MSYKMCEDNCLVLPNQSLDSRTEAGIIVPGKVKDRPVIGTVLAVGPGMKMDDGSRFKETLKIGSIVVFPKKSGDYVYLDGQNFIIIPSRYILMILSEPYDGEEEYMPEDDEHIENEENKDE